MKGENLMVVPSTAEGFRAAIRGLRSLEGMEGLRFHIFTFPGDGFLRLLVKKLGKRRPESVVRE
jgi:hypothetical protein